MTLGWFLLSLIQGVLSLSSKREFFNPFSTRFFVFFIVELFFPPPPPTPLSFFWSSLLRIFLLLSRKCGCVPSFLPSTFFLGAFLMIFDYCSCCGIALSQSPPVELPQAPLFAPFRQDLFAISLLFPLLYSVNSFRRVFP